MKILTVGDSFTFGLELPDLPTGELDFFGRVTDEFYRNPQDVKPSKLAWPNLLAKKLQAHVKNISQPGASNDWIFKKTIQHVLSRKYDVVVVAWTCVDRYDFALGEKELQLSANNEYFAEAFPWFKHFVTDHYDFTLAYDKWICQALALEGFLKQRNVPYIFVNAITPHIIYDSGDITSKLPFDFKNDFDHQFYLDWDSSLQEWCRGLPVGPGGHFLEEGHELVASRLYNFIVNNIPLEQNK